MGVSAGMSWTSLKVQEEKAVVIFFNRLGRVAPARDEMGSIKLKLDILGIGMFEDAIQIRRTLAESVEVIVITERNAEVRGSFAQFRK